MSSARVWGTEGGLAIPGATDGGQSLEAAGGSLAGGSCSQVNVMCKARQLTAGPDSGEGGGLVTTRQGSRPSARGPGCGAGLGLAGSGGYNLGKEKQKPVLVLGLHLWQGSRLGKEGFQFEAMGHQGHIHQPPSRPWWVYSISLVPMNIGWRNEWIDG